MQDLDAGPPASAVAPQDAARTGPSAPAWPPMVPTEQIAVATTVGAFRALKQRWIALTDAHALPTHVFQQFGWIDQWLRYYSDSCRDGDLAIGTAERDGQLVLVMPLFIQRIAGVRCLKWAGDPVTQYGDIVVGETADPMRLISSVFDAVISEARADVCFLQRVRSDSQIAPFLDHLGASVSDPNEAPFLDLTQFADFDAFIDSRFSRRKQREHKRLRRRLDETGTVHIAHDLTGAQAGDVAADAIRLKRDWLAAKSLASKALTDERSLAFMRGVAADETNTIATHVGALTSDGALAAAQIGFPYKRRLSLHVIVYDLQFQRAAPGLAHLRAGITKAFEDGVQAIDLLAPTADYKRDWATGAIPVADYTYAATSKGRAFAALYLKHLRPWLKKIAPRVPLALRKMVRSTVASVGF
ncbi:MAG: GNAT family N-acetyltransferase [Pseudomonadota bacterium]